MIRLQMKDGSYKAIDKYKTFGDCIIHKTEDGLQTVTYIGKDKHHGKRVAPFYLFRNAKALCLDEEFLIATGNRDMKTMRDRTQHYIQEDFDEYVGRKEKKEL